MLRNLNNTNTVYLFTDSNFWEIRYKDGVIESAGEISDIFPGVTVNIDAAVYYFSPSFNATFFAAVSNSLFYTIPNSDTSFTERSHL